MVFKQGKRKMQIQNRIQKRISNRVLFRARALAFGLITSIILPICSQGQSKHISLFNGKDLAGWETQGLGTWSVVGGVIVGTKPKTQIEWAHLVSKNGFTDCYYRLKYKIDSGNSGAYVRGSIGGSFGVNGLQVEMGGNEGSMMTVTKSEWKWLPGNPVVTPQYPMGQWHELAIEIKGQGISTWVDGKFMQKAESIDTALLPKTGVLALQMHAGSYQNTMSFKDIEVFTPTLITGCMDSRFREFDPLANDSSTGACKTITAGIRRRSREVLDTYQPKVRNQGKDLRGRFIPRTKVRRETEMRSRSWK
jgi:hypothetical protein